jgi:Topoisomerase VI B subunit, transducer
MGLVIYILFHFSPQVFEGHPFMVEAGVSLGGKDVKQVEQYLSCFELIISTKYFFSDIPIIL